MAIFKTSDSLTGISGKIGGQSLSKQTQYNTIRNISQPAKFPTTLQARQRFNTSSITGTWRTLTPSQKQDYADTAFNYTYLNAFDIPITRTRFGVFNFIAQNLLLLGSGPLADAPVYIPVEIPVISVFDVSPTELIIQGSNVSSSYLYPLFVQVNLNPGQKGIGRQLRHVGNLTSAQLAANVDILPMILNYFSGGLNSSFLSFGVGTINQTTGNRAPDLNLITVELSTVLPCWNYIATFPFVTRQLFNALITPDGSKFTSIVWGAPGQYYVYDMLVPFDITSLANPQIVSLGNRWIQSAHFVDNGNILVVRRHNFNDIRTYDCTTPYSVIGATIRQEVPLAGFLSRMSPDGLKLINISGTVTSEWLMTTPFDLTTLTFVQDTSVITPVTSLFVSPDGRFLLTSRNVQLWSNYRLNVPWSLSSITPIVVNLNAISIIPQNNFPGICFSEDGKFLYQPIYQVNGGIVQTELCVPFTLPSSL